MSDHKIHDFSLFEGDALNKFFTRIGLKSRGIANLLGRVGFLLLVTWLPTALLAWFGGFRPGQPRTLNFFGDVAAWGQAFLGYPLFILAEYIISKKTRSCARHFSTSGLLEENELPKLFEIHSKLHALRKRFLPDIICLTLGFIFSMMWLYGETHNDYDTWHALGAPAVQSPTYAGYWVAFIGIPVFNYWWLRWIWKICVWCWYLYKVSCLELKLIASHPDQTGGIGFVSETQASFAIIIFAFGIGVIAPLIGYKLEIEHAQLFSFSVGGPLIAFIIGAPTFFTIPLLMFTKRLARTKRRAVEAFQDRATAASRVLEQKWLNETEEDGEMRLGTYMMAIKNLNSGLEFLSKMRVVPFDIRSFSQLIGSTLGSLLPIITKITDLPVPILKFLETVKKFTGGE